MIAKIVSKAYGEGNSPSYDPRFPGYFSATFTIKGRPVRISNIKKSQLSSILEIVEHGGAAASKETFSDGSSKVCGNISKGCDFIEFRY